MGNKDQHSREAQDTSHRSQFFQPSANVRETMFFLWIRSQSVTLKRLCKNVCREVVAYLYSNYCLVKFECDHLATFNLLEGVWSKPRFFSQKVEIPSQTTYTFVDYWTVFCCGFCERYAAADFDVGEKQAAMVGRKTYTLDLSTETITVKDLPQMIDCRRLPGTICYEGTVYVFGGVFLRSQDDADSFLMPHLKTSEFLDLSEGRVWTSLPRMNTPRFAFLPLLYRKRFYLPDRLNSPHFEVFDPHTHSYTHPIQIGNQLPRVAWVAFDSIVIVSESVAEKVNLSHPSLPSCSLACDRELNLSVSPSPLVVGTDCLHYVGKNSKVYRIRVEGNRMIASVVRGDEC